MAADYHNLTNVVFIHTGSLLLYASDSFELVPVAIIVDHVHL